MIDCKQLAVADGHTAVYEDSVSCLLNSDLTDGFVVSGFLDNQSFTISSEEKIHLRSECVKPSQIPSDDTVFFVRSNHTKEITVSVKCSQSAYYIVSKQISHFVNITVDCLRSAFNAVRRNIIKIINHTKGEYFRRRVYSLCLLRL